MHTVFPLQNKTTEPENSMPAGTNATSAFSNVAFIAWFVMCIVPSRDYGKGAWRSSARWSTPPILSSSALPLRQQGQADSK